MNVRRLHRRSVQRVWGDPAPPAWAGAVAAAGPLGEVWYEDDDADSPLLIKYLFTRERLSIQVHPDDAAARAAGLPRGKDEAWLIIAAKPGAVIGLGLKRFVSKDELRIAAQDGRIADLVEWRPVRPGDFLFSPAGTVHAIGAGLVVLEIQQNLDRTYRLYDYGRGRELHLEEGVAAAHTGPWHAPPPATATLEAGREILHDGDTFVVERWTGEGRCRVDSGVASMLLAPLAPGGSLAGHSLAQGDVWRIDGAAELVVAGDQAIIAVYPAQSAPPARSWPQRGVIRSGPA